MCRAGGINKLWVRAGSATGVDGVGPSNSRSSKSSSQHQEQQQEQLLAFLLGKIKRREEGGLEGEGGGIERGGRGKKEEGGEII